MEKLYNIKDLKRIWQAWLDNIEENHRKVEETK